jgi:hypothetical protein
MNSSRWFEFTTRSESPMKKRQSTLNGQWAKGNA